MLLSKRDEVQSPVPIVVASLRNSLLDFLIDIFLIVIATVRARLVRYKKNCQIK